MTDSVVVVLVVSPELLGSMSTQSSFPETVARFKACCAHSVFHRTIASINLLAINGDINQSDILDSVKYLSKPFRILLWAITLLEFLSANIN